MFLHFKRIVLPIVTLTVFTTLCWATSPPNLPTDIPWQDSGGTGNEASYAGVADITAAFNNARRQEENQLGLAANTISDLILPSELVWAGLSDDAKALYLINDERRSRTGMLSGVLGLPYAGIETNIDGLAQYYAQYLHDNDATGHNADGAGGPFTRIDNDPEIGITKNCHEFLPRSENLAYFATTGNSISLPIERAIYSWIYDDASSSWGHREAALLQDIALNGQAAFINNNGSNDHTGFLGFHHITSTDYQPFPNFPSNTGSVVVMDFFDPVSDDNASLRGCNYPISLIENDILKGLNEVLKRGEMAKAILQAKNIIPDANATGTEYTDVPPLHLNAVWIEKFKQEGLTEGCDANNFCPDMAVTKEQMAIIFLKSKFGSTYLPNPVGAPFSDVLAGSYNSDWITVLKDQGITSGCDTNKFCPKQLVTREWFAALLNEL